MYGTDNATGQYLTGLNHLSQSIADVLTTPLNSRVMKRGYGCRLFDLVDAPITEAFRVQAVEAVFTALTRWEPRLSLDRVDVNGSPGGVLAITLTGGITGTDRPYSQQLDFTREQLYRH